MQLLTDDQVFGKAPVGLRNNNPGNLRASPDSFQSFDTPDLGLEAAAKNIIAYNDKHGLNTISGIISRWAPPSENNTGSYIKSVSAKTGFAPDQPLNVKDPAVLGKLVSAITNHENGFNPFSDEQTLKAAQNALSYKVASNAPVAPPSQSPTLSEEQVFGTKPLSDEEVFGKDAQKVNKTSVDKTIMDQGLQGATFGWGDELTDPIGTGFAYLYAKSQGMNPDLGEAYNAARTDSQNRLKDEWKERPILSLASNVAGGALTSGAANATKAGTALNNWVRSGDTAARIGKGALTGAASGGLYGAGAADDGNRIEGTAKGAVAGGIIGGAVPAAGAAYDAVKGALVPEVSQDVAKLARRAQDFNIRLSVSQVAPSRVRNTVQKISQELPFSGVDTFEKNQVSDWNSALANTIGQDAKNLNPDTIINFSRDNSAKFDQAFQGINFNIPESFKNDLAGIVEDAKSSIDDGLSGVVEKNVNNVLKQISEGNISGDKLASVRSQLLKKMSGMRNEASGFLGDIVDKIDDVATEQMPQESLDLLGEARREWRNFKTLQPLLEKSTDGIIKPTDLMNRVAASKYINASKLPIGQDDIVDLARIGKQFMPKLGGSDTFQKALYGYGPVALGATTMANPALGAAMTAKAAGGIAANAAFQKMYNQAPNSVKAIIQASLENGEPATVTSQKINQLMQFLRSVNTGESGAASQKISITKGGK